MDEITTSLRSLVETKNIDNWRLVEELITNLDDKYRYYVWFMFRKSIPADCAKCEITYTDDSNVVLMWRFITDYTVRIGLKKGPDIRIFNYDFYLKIYNDHIIGSGLEDMKQQPCCNDPL